VAHRVFDTQREQRRIFAQSDGRENKQCSKRKNNSAARKFWSRPYHLEDFLGPIKLPTRFVFDLKLALSFNCLTMVCCCFRAANCSVTSC
jgi:hypothetical protein